MCIALQNCDIYITVILHFVYEYSLSDFTNTHLSAQNKMYSSMLTFVAWPTPYRYGGCDRSEDRRGLGAVRWIRAPPPPGARSQRPPPHTYKAPPCPRITQCHSKTTPHMYRRPHSDCEACCTCVVWSLSGTVLWWCVVVAAGNSPLEVVGLIHTLRRPAR